MERTLEEPNLHRNNAAEWVMYAALWPVAKAVAVVLFLKRTLTRK